MGRPAKAHYNRKYGCWVTTALGEARVAATGKVYRPLTRFADLKHPTRDALEAQARLHKLLKEAEAQVVYGDDITFRQLTEFYLEDLEKTKKVGRETFDRKVEHLTRFGDWPDKADPGRMDALPCRRIASEDVERFLEEMKALGRSESYISEGLLKNLKACFAWAARIKAGRYAGLPLESNPIRDLRGPAVQRRAARELDPALVRKFLRWAWRRALKMPKLKRRFAQISTILMLCQRDVGSRPKEICCATWDEWKVLPDGWGVIALPPTKWKNGKKTGKGRILAVPPHCAKRIEWIRNLEGRHPTHIFTHRRGRGDAINGIGSPWSGVPWVEDYAKDDTKSLQKWFYRLANDARAEGVPLPKGCRLYWLRSSYSTEAQRRGVSRSLLAEAMGTSERMLERNYTDFNQSDVLDAAKRARGAD